MCVNDLITCGAQPLFFLDYFATSALDIDQASLIIKSIAMACKSSGCALLGGETAEMPGHYIDKNFDLAGFSVGIVDEQKIITGSTIASGNVIIGIESSGPHSNGYSLIRKIISESSAPKNEIDSIIDLVLKPTHLYPELVSQLLKKIKINGMAHITGGGITENIPRIIPNGLGIDIFKESWNMPKAFQWLQEQGDISDNDMYRIFNCGVGMTLIVDESIKDEAIENIKSQGYEAFYLGNVHNRDTESSVTYL